MSSSSLKITSLGGFGDVNRNMFVYELPNDGDILIVDCGIGFPTDEMLGVDLLIPDISYLKNKEHRIKGMLISHGHEDHVGALPYILPNLPNFPIYASKLTAALGQNKLDEYQINRHINIIDPQQTLQIGDYTIKPIRVSHSIPDTLHFYIQSPLAKVYHGADFKFDWTPVDGIQPEVAKIATAGNSGIDLLISDCLGSERKGATRSELELYDMFNREISTCKGKFIVTAMSSSISRLQQVIEVSVAHGRKIAALGRSIEKNIRIATELRYLKVKPNQFIRPEKIKSMPPHQLTLLVAGSQGQPGSALQRAATSEHRLLEIKPGDKVVFSTDYIPGSETSIHAAIDALYKQGAIVIYADIKDDLHVSGHGSQADLKLLLGLTRPQYALPIGGTYRHMVHYKILAQNMGHPSKNILMPSANHCIYVNSQKCYIGEKQNINNIMVDGLGIGDVGNIVLRDRKVLAEEGIVIVLLETDLNTNQLIGTPDIITRGFVYIKEQDQLLNEAKKLVSKALNRHSDLTDWHLIKETTVTTLQKFFNKRLNRHPMILPVIIEA